MHAFDLNSDNRLLTDFVSPKVTKRPLSLRSLYFQFLNTSVYRVTEWATIHQCKGMFVICHVYFCNSLILQVTANKKQFWKTMKYMRSDKSTIPTLSLDDNEATTDKDKSTMLNLYFSDLFNKSLPSLNVPSVTMLSEVNPNTIEELLCTEEEVLQPIQISKSSGPDMQDLWQDVESNNS